MANEMQTLPPDQDQREIILNQLDTTMLVEAAAGTGKTTSMVGRLTALLRYGKCEVEQIAAVTFTRKAAGELRSRFQIALERSLKEENLDDKKRQRLERALGKIEQCFIGTIHAFCGRLLRERPVEAKIDLSFSELDDPADRLLREQVWDEFAAEMLAGDHPDLQLLDEAGLGIHQLKSAFLQIADYPDVDEWPVDDVPMPDFDPILKALTGYVAHMRHVAKEFPKDCGTDTLMPKYKLISRLAWYFDLTKPARVMEILSIFGNAKVTQKNWPGQKEQALDEKNRWEEFIETVVEPAKKQWFAYRYKLIMRILYRAMEKYEQRRLRMGVLNFQDLLLKTAQLLRDHPHVRRYFRNRLTHLLVDEFQDTDPIQAEILLLLTADDEEVEDWRHCRPVPGSLFVVGDPKQSIYRFRRADIVTYNRVKKIIRESGGEQVSLSANFRTEKPLLEWANSVFADWFPDTADDYSPAYVAFDAGRPVEYEGPYLRTLTAAKGMNKQESQELEADHIARRICNEYHAGTARPGDFMIVSWKKGSLSTYAEALKRYQIPHLVSGGGSLNQSKALALLKVCLNAVLHPENPIALVALLRSELFGLPDTRLFAFKKARGEFSFLRRVPQGKEFTQEFESIFQRLKDYERWMRKLPPVTAIEKIVDSIGLSALAAKGEGGNEEAGNLCKAMELIRARQEEFSSLDDVMAFLDDLINQSIAYDSIPGKPYDQSVVQVMNLHKVKGLEAPVVFLANPSGKSAHRPELHIDRGSGLVRGYLRIYEESGFQQKDLACPMDWPQMEEEEQKYFDAEEIRLLYVAATRAKREMVISLREDRKKQNYWNFFDAALSDVEPMPVPEAAEMVAETPSSFDLNDIQPALAGMQNKWRAIARPTYRLQSVKSRVVEGRESYGEFGEHGSEWGIVIHQLLEHAMNDPQADLSLMAQIYLQEQNLQEMHTPEEMVAAVQSVVGSDIWKRARQGKQCFTEIPFQSLERGDTPTLLRGVID
ncbi:AAA family ATPase, partial [bacterium]|nr:AAA family ATPase [bacterium]